MLPTDEFPSSGLAGFLNQFVEFFLKLGSRLLVHICSLIGAGIVSSTVHIPDAGAMVTGATVFTAYVGFICLVPHGSPRTVDWLIPSGLGAFLAVAWTVWGLPWQFCIIWGGALTWTIRLLMKRGMMDWEWSVVPAMLLAMYGFFDDLLPWCRVGPPYLTFPLLVLAGWGALRLYARLMGDSVQKSMLLEACARLEKLVSDKKIPPELEQSVRKLAVQGRRLLELKPRLDQSTSDLSRSLADISGKLARLGTKLTPIGAAKARDTLDRLSKSMDERLRALEPAKEETPLSAEARALAARVEEFRSMARGLVEKAASLPEDLRTPVQGVADATENILACMLKDPQDVAPGDRFLSRYLKAAHTVVDEHVRLAPQAGASREVSEALAKSKDLLLRLEKAFTEEHAALLRNDTMNFTAELNVLDKLLKMEGK